MKKYIVTVKAIVKYFLFRSERTASQIVETDDIGKELLYLQDVIDKKYSGKITIKEIEYKEII